MPKYTVTIQDETGNSKTVIVDTEDMNATVVQNGAASDAQAQVGESDNLGIAKMHNNGSHGGKRSAPSFRLKKRRTTRKLKKTR
jgi:hypothetical protein